MNTRKSTVLVTGLGVIAFSIVLTLKSGKTESGTGLDGTVLLQSGQSGRINENEAFANLDQGVLKRHGLGMVPVSRAYPSRDLEQRGMLSETGIRKSFERISGMPLPDHLKPRFLDASGKDVIPRKDKVWSLGALAERMAETLTKNERAVPNYLQALIAESTPDLQKAAFAMHCFWTGEARIGALDGVVNTEAGTLDNSYKPAKESDQKKQLEGTSIAQKRKQLQLTPMQATKLNALIRSDKNKALSWLTPRQLQLLQADQ